MAYRHVGLNSATRRKSALTKFVGVDYSNQRFNVEQGRAIDLMNFEYRDSVAQSREGFSVVGPSNYPSSSGVTYFYFANHDYSSIAHSATTIEELVEAGLAAHYSNGVNGVCDEPVYGMWRFEAEDGNEHIIAHIGEMLFEVSDLEKGRAVISPLLASDYSARNFDSTSLKPVFRILPRPTKKSGFVGAKKFYILSGEGFLCLRFLSGGTVRYFDVANHSSASHPEEDTYIPTTTIGITDSAANYSNRALLDDVNLMTKWRYNEISGREDEYIQSDDFVYELDSPIYDENGGGYNGFSIEFSSSGFSSYLPLDRGIQSVNGKTYLQADGSYDVEIEGERGSDGYGIVRWNKGPGYKLLDFVKSSSSSTVSVTGFASFSFTSVEGTTTDGVFTETSRTVHAFSDLSATFTSDGKVCFDDGDFKVYVPYVEVEGSSVSLYVDPLNCASIYLTQVGRDMVFGRHSVPKNSNIIIATDSTADITSYLHAASWTPAVNDYPKYTHAVTIKETDGSLCLYILRQATSTSNLEAFRVIGYVENLGKIGKNGIVHLFNNYIPMVVGSTSVKVKFPCFVSGNSDRIGKCQFGQLFGNSNAKNRLFASGNPDFANCDWHSGQINESKIPLDQYGKRLYEDNGNFSYWSDMDYNYYQQTDNAVCGYDIVSDGKMVVLMTESDKEPTIYYRTSTLIAATDAAGNTQVGVSGETLYEEAYPMVVGSIGAGCVSPWGVANFNGDTLFVSSENEVDGLDITESIANSQRYSNSRSKYIDPKLKGLNMDKSVLWVCGKYLYLSTGSEIYLAHSDTMHLDYVNPNDKVGSKQYEWWKLDIKNAISFLKVGDSEYFGTSDGYICKLRNGSQKDKKVQFYSVSSFTMSAITLSAAALAKLDPNAEHTLLKRWGDVSDSSAGALFWRVANGFANPRQIDLDLTNNRYLVYSVEVEKRINEKDPIFIGRNVYMSMNEGISGESGKAKKLYARYEELSVPNSRGAISAFKVYDEAGNEINLSNYTSGPTKDIFREVSSETVLRKVDGSETDFNLLDPYGEKMNLFCFNLASTSTAVSYFDVIERSPIAAYYISAPFTMGDLMNNKTVWAWTLTNDTNLESAFEVGVADNGEEFDYMQPILRFAKTDFGYSFSQYDFGSLSFDKCVVPHKYTYYRPTNVPFLCFAIRNIPGEKAVLSSLQILYTISNASFADI